jgi:ABC-type nitrate/sulfonate/bicarbonate transport system substrate-binding protein
MPGSKLTRAVHGLVFAGLVMLAPVARAETVTIGLVGKGVATQWPLYVGLKKGFYDQAGLKFDMVTTPSSQAVLQQLAAGSLDMALSAGLVDPIHAIDKGAPIAILRLEMQAPPYAMLAKPTLKNMSELKGKLIMVDNPKGITLLYAERMLGPNGVKPDQFDKVYAGSTAARLAALKSGAVDAAVLLPPFSFMAEEAGFHNLGLTIKYAGDLPFTGSVVNRKWAASHKDTLDRLLAAHNKSMAWFLDPKNRDEAITIIGQYSKMKPELIAKTYDFLQKNNFFDATGTVSKAKMKALLGALKQLGDLQGSDDVGRFVLAGVTKLSD